LIDSTRFFSMAIVAAFWSSCASKSISCAVVRPFSFVATAATFVADL